MMKSNNRLLKNRIFSATRAAKYQLLALKAINKEMLIREKGHEEFVHMTIHELKSPVSVLKAYLQILELKFAKENRDDYLDFSGKMNLQLEKLLNLISDLLDGTKAGAGTLSYQMSNFNINDCLIECIDGIKATHPEITILNHLNTDLEINGDKDRIGQVINNLIGNAIKYSQKEKYIKVESSIKENEVCIKVIDKGIGIPPGKQKSVFDRFYRVDHHVIKKVPGLGLGLYISSEIIKKHDGQIGLESRENIGSVFWFSLPIKSNSLR